MKEKKLTEKPNLTAEPYTDKRVIHLRLEVINEAIRLRKSNDCWRKSNDELNEHWEEFVLRKIDKIFSKAKREKEVLKWQ